MKAEELIMKSPFKIDLGKHGEYEVTGMTYDSRKVMPGNIFFAIKGLKEDGNKYIESAMSKGAGIIFSEETSGEFGECRIIKVKEIRKMMAVLSRIFYTKGLKGIKLIGVTGTNGKTTTTFLIRHFLESTGNKTGLIGTIDYHIGDSVIDSTLTTPDSIELNVMLGKMENEKINYCVMEVSSVALEMDRVYGLEFDTAVFTNLTSEHMDFHKNMDNYFGSKKILFDGLSKGSFAVSNKDDEFGERILKNTKAEKYFYSMNSESNLKSFNEKLTMQGLEFEVNYAGKTYNFRSDLSGRFNVYNILASLSVAANYNIDFNILKESLLNFREVSGRFNKIKLDNGAVAIIDYSHTSDSLENAIRAAREIIEAENKNGRIITIFGCGGDKDKTKRPVMGRTASELSDYVIVTSDNPRSEDPMEIINQILKGIKRKSEIEIIEDREKAILHGLEVSKKNDIVLICGKGHETYQEIKGIRNHFDDREMVSKYNKLFWN